MPRVRMNARWIENVPMPPAPKQIDYFDDPSGKQGVRGLILRVSYGHTRSWRVMHYIDGGKSRTFALGRYPVMDLSQARLAARAFLSDPAKHIEQRAEPETFEAVVADYMRLHVRKKQLRTERVIKQRIDKHFMPTFKSYRFSAIRRRDLVKRLDEIEEAHGAIMADAMLQLFASMAKWMAGRDEDYRTPIGPNMRRHNRVPRQRALDDDELRVLWQATHELGTYGAILRVLAFTGARRSKVAFMRRSDVDDDGVWHIHTELNEKPNVGKIKLPRPVLDIIESQPRFDKCDYVFVGSRGKTPFNSWGQMGIELTKIERRIMPDMKPHTVHDIRRSFRTRCSKLGIDRSISEWCIGHVVGSKIERTYDVWRPDDEMTKAFEAVAQNIMAIVAPRPPDNVVPIGSSWNHRTTDRLNEASGPV
jgi:integrase